MARIKLKDGLKFELNGREFQLVERASPGEWKTLNVLTGQQDILSEATIYNFLFKKELKFITAISQQHAAFPDLSDEKKAEAIWREKYVSEILSRGIHKSTPQALEPVIQEVYFQLQISEDIPRKIKDKSKPSQISVYRWLKKYKQSEGNIHSLVSNTSSQGNRNSNLDREVSQIIEQAINEIYLNPNRPSIEDTHSRVIVLIVEENQRRKHLNLPDLNIPSYATTRRAIHKILPQERDKARLGTRTSDLIHKAVYVGQGLTATRPLEIVAIDHSLLPFYVLDNEYRLPVGLVWLTSAIDVYTQTVVGYYLTFEPPSYLSIMYCLLHSIKQKDYVRSTYKSVKKEWTSFGLMENLKVDNGTDFSGKSLEDACRELDITLEFCPVRMPWYKAIIERHFGSLKKQFSGTIPGRCLEFLEKSDYDPKKQAIITLNELQEIVHIFLVDIHNQSKHTSLKSPRISVWNHAIQSYPVSVPSSANSLEVLLGDVEERTISRTGIEFNYLFYNSDRLQLLRQKYDTEDLRRRDKSRGKEKAKIKYNRNDISVMYVFDPDSREYVAVPANDRDYTLGLSLHQHKIIRKYAENKYGKVDIVALALAKQEIRDIISEAIKETKAVQTSRKVIKFLGTGRGEGVIQAQAQSLKITEQAEAIDDIIDNTELPLPSASSGISDFASALDLDEKIEEPVMKISSKDTINAKSKAKTEVKPKSSERTVASTSKSKLAKSQQENPDPDSKSQNLDDVDKSNLSVKKDKEQQLSQEKQSQGFIGLPKWIPPSRQ